MTAYKKTTKAIIKLVANRYDADATLVKMTVPEDWKAKDAKTEVEDDENGLARAVAPKDGEHSERQFRYGN